MALLHRCVMTVEDFMYYINIVGNIISEYLFNFTPVKNLRMQKCNMSKRILTILTAMEFSYYNNDASFLTFFSMFKKN